MNNPLHRVENGEHMEGEHYVYTLAYPESMGGCVFYVGKGSRDRINNHEQHAKKGRRSHKCNIIRKIWRYGEQVVKKKVAIFETNKDALHYERALIFFMPNLVNIKLGGDPNNSGMIVSEETRRKLSERAKGRIITEEARQKMSLARKGKTYFSKIHRQRLSDAGKRRSQEVARRVAAANRGRTRSEEIRRKMSIQRKGKIPTNLNLVHQRNIGRIKSEETRQKLSDSLKGRSISEEARQKMSLAKKGKIPTNLDILHEKTRQRAAQKREQALLAMRYPEISPTDAEWKQGIAPLSLWD